MIKTVVYFMLKALLVIEIFTFFSCLFGLVDQRLDKKTKIRFKTFDVTDCTSNNYNTQIAQYLKK